GHEATIVTYKLTDSREEFRNMTRLLPCFDRVRIVELENGGMREAVFGSRSRPILRQLVADADIVHLHNVWESILRVAGEEAFRARKPYLIQPNDILNPFSISHHSLKK